MVFSQPAVQGGYGVKSVGDALSYRAIIRLLFFSILFFFKRKQTQIAPVAQCVTVTVCWMWVGRHQGK